MPYKACYDCELLFEVDGTSDEMACTECGAALVDYTPDEAELAQLEDEATEGETLMLTADQVASGMSSGVVATMAIEGLAAKLRAAAEAGGNPDALLPQRRVSERPAPQPTPAPQPVRVEPSPRSVQPVKLDETPQTAPLPMTAEAPRPAPMRNAQSNSRATKMLDVSELDPNDWGSESQPVPQLPTFPEPQQPAFQPEPMAQRPAQPAPRPVKKKKGKAGLLIAIVVLIGAAGGGVAAWYFTQDKTPKPDVEQPATTASEAAPKTFAERIAADVERTSVRLPEVRNAAGLEEGQYLIASMEGLVFSEGQVPGLATARLNEGVIGNEEGREFVTPVRAAFERTGLKADAPFGLALDSKLVARDALRFVYSAQLAGATQQGFIVRGTDGYGLVRYALQVGPLGDLADGVLVVRVGKIGFHVTVKDAAGEVVSEGEPRIPLRDDRSLDMDALEQRLDGLVKAHAGVRTAVVYPSSEMFSEDLVAILGRLARGPEGPRFPDVRIALP